MSFFAPSLKQLSFVGLCLALIVIASISFSSYQTNWSGLVYDRPAGREIVDVENVFLSASFPLLDDQLVAILSGQSGGSPIRIEVENLSRNDVSGEKISFNDQAIAALNQFGPIPNTEDERYAFYTDLNADAIKALDSPRVLFHRLPSTKWELYQGKVLIGSGSNRDNYISVPLLDLRESSDRLTFVAVNRNPGRLTGIYFTYGLTIRSANEAAWAQQNLPSQHQYPRLLAAVFLLVFALVGFSMAWSTPQYTDVWAYAAFCGTLAVNVWKQTPFFWGAYDWSSSGVSLPYDVAWLSFVLLFMLTAVILNLTFFRVRGHYFRIIVGGATASAIYVFCRNYPGWNPEIKSYQAYANVGQAVVVLLLFSQGIGSLLGFTDLYQELRRSQASGISPRVQKIKRRIGYALVFTFGIGVMQYFYLSGLVKQSTTPGPDLFLLAGIVPAGLILLLFSWTIGAANRDRLKLAPSLEVIDELLLEYGDKAIYETDKSGKPVIDQYGHPVKLTYTGMLAWFDLKGFTMTDSLRRIDERHRVEVDQFLIDVDQDLSDLYHRLFPRFRFKWAGDELSWAYFARDKADADAMIVKAFSIWQENAARLTAKWKADLIRRLGDHIDPAVVEAMDYVDVHVAFARLDELKIKPGLFESKADYESPSYTRISRAFKKSTHLRVAVFADVGGAIVAGANGSVEFQPAITQERLAELRRQLEKDPGSIKLINEELMLEGTGFLVFSPVDRQNAPFAVRDDAA